MKNIFQKFIVLPVSAILVLLSVLQIALPDKEFSAKENRSLQSLPQFSFVRLASGEYTTKIGGYLSDQFPFRDAFVSVKAYSELLQGKRENNGVIYAKGGVLIPKGSITENRLAENLNIIKDFEKSVGKSVTVAPLPRSVDIYASLLPEGYPYEQENAVWQEYEEESRVFQKSFVYLKDALMGDDTYYRTDHHYTAKGAYLAYCALAESLGYEPKAESFFSPEAAADDFCGTSMRTSGFYFAPKDTITLYRYENDTEYSVCADGEDISLYDFEKLDTTDKYAVFLGGNHARVDINGSGDRERLLIIRDSFSDSIAPFLAIHYDITLIDLRYYTDSVRQLVKDEGIDKVLVLQSITELSQAKNISVLVME